MLAGCAGLTAAGAGFASRSAQATVPRQNSELFAFASSDLDNVVFALALEPREKRDKRLTVRMHVGNFSFTAEPRQGDYHLSKRGVRLFTGIVSRLDESEPTTHLVAVAVPAERLPAQSLEVWAEIVTADGARSRVGNPVVAQLLAGDAPLTQIHAGLQPSMDRHVLSDMVVGRIAARSNNREDRNALVRAKRLAAMVMPDTLKFHPARPSGFTFAAMNGRRPEDAVDEVAGTMLAGMPRTGRNQRRYRSSDQFPYFAATKAA